MTVGMRYSELDRLSDGEAMGVVADAIDLAAQEKDADKAREALELCDYLSHRIEGRLSVQLSYFKANAWSAIRLARHRDESEVWHWDQPELLQEVYWLRSAICSDEFVNLEPFVQCQILVNTGNILSNIGRIIDAIEYWRRALVILPNFAMALGNLGFGYETYAKSLYDSGHMGIVLKEAHDALRTVTRKDILWDRYDFEVVRRQMLARADLIAKHVDIHAVGDVLGSEFSLGRSIKEKQYRNWSLGQGLFINPLNDVVSGSIAAQDVLHLPNMVTEVEEPPSLIGLYNQIKQEYVSARYLLWEGIEGNEHYRRHMSDNSVHLVNTLDYPLYGLSVEKVKLAFRSSYSLFDKIAFFINAYWKLGAPEGRVNFQNVWFEFKEKGRASRGLHPVLSGRRNLMLRGLYWLSKDFIESDKRHKIVLGQTMEPDAEKLRSVRNSLEHKYLKVHDNFWTYGRDLESPSFSDELADHITFSELSSKSLRLMKLARAALVYLSLSVHEEERSREREDSKIILPMHLPGWK